MRQIPLTRGFVACVNDEDFEWLSKFKWHALVGRGGITYACRRGKGKYLWMHREILNAPDSAVVDHWDRDGLNNTRENIRICTNSANNHNRRHRPNKTGFKGVQLVTGYSDRWSARIKASGRKRHLGCFSTPEAAARAFDAAAVALYGRYARTNFPMSLHRTPTRAARGVLVL